MKCTKCGADNDSGAKFCVKCGSGLTAETTRSFPRHQSKPGGFHRFCLVASAVWTAYLLGSFLALGMNMVNSGVASALRGIDEMGCILNGCVDASQECGKAVVRHAFQEEVP